MSQSSENTGAQPGTPRETDGADPAGTAATLPDAASEGASRGAEFRAVLADFNGDSQAPAAQPPPATVSNRNLSDVIQKIRDDGPPASRSGQVASIPAAAAGSGGIHLQDDTAAPAARRSVPRRSMKRPLLLLLLLVIAVPALLVLAGRPLTGLPGHATISDAMDGIRRYLAGLSVPTTTTPTLQMAGQDPGYAEQLQGLEARQIQLMARMDELSATVATFSTSDNKQPDTAFDEFARQQRSELEGIDAAVAALQTLHREQDAAVPPKPGNTKSAAGATASSPVPAADGEWVLNIASSSREESVWAMMDKLAAMGVDSEQQTVTADGETLYRLRITGFATKQEAKDYAGKLGKRIRLSGPWVSRR